MAQNIVMWNLPREQQFQANQNRINVVSEGIQQLGTTAAQFIMAYQQQVKEEKEKRLAAMTMIGSKSGFNNMGPDFMNEYEKLIGGTPSKPILPRDASGNAFMPPSLEEKHKQDILDMFKNDPEKMKQVKMQMEGLMAPSMDPTKASIEQGKLDVLKERAGMDAWFKQQRIQLEGYRAAISAGKAGKEDAPSGVVIDENGKPKFVGVGPGAAPSLTTRQLKAMNVAGQVTSRQLANQSRQLLDAERQYKLDHPKNDYDKLGADAFKALIKLPVAKRTQEMYAMAMTWAQDNLDQDQIDETFKDIRLPGTGWFGREKVMPAPISRKGKGKEDTTPSPTPSSEPSAPIDANSLDKALGF
jgi:hypothetical protein